jgi:adenylosuccinate lyase
MILLDDILAKTDRVLSTLVIDAGRMRANIDAQKGLVMAEKVMLALVDKGVARDEAHEMLREASMEALSKGDGLEDVCARDSKISDIFDSAELSDLFRPEGHLGHSGRIVDEAVAKARTMLD